MLIAVCDFLNVVAIVIGVDDIEEDCAYDACIEGALGENMFKCFSFMFVLSEEACVARSFPVGFGASFRSDEVTIVNDFLYCISDVDSDFRVCSLGHDVKSCFLDLCLR